MFPSFHTSGGHPVSVYFDEENGGYDAFIDEYMQNPCFIPAGRGFTVAAAILDLERCIEYARAEEWTSDCIERRDALSAEFDVLIEQLRKQAYGSD